MNLPVATSVMSSALPREPFVGTLTSQPASHHAEAHARAARLQARVRELTDQLDPRTGVRAVIGESTAWRSALAQAVLVAPTSTTVLLGGESGTGKEVAARFLHRVSARSQGPFVAINCAALPEELLEAELFGCERGAYTGAIQSRTGRIEQAAGGTLFLDEVGEMSLKVQAKILRVLQEREFQRLGGTRVQRADIRVVAATNRDLRSAIADGRFREDLYYRLHVFPIFLPPLRQRRDDIPRLADAFLTDIGRSLGVATGGLSRDATQALLAYDWPGNVRELRNTLERASILADGEPLTVEYLGLPEATMAPATLPSPSRPNVPVPMPPACGTLDGVERGLIHQALTAARFNKSRAAQALGLTRHQLYVRMRKHGIQ